MQRTHRRFHLGVFGGSGTGKNTYVCKFIAHAAASCVFIYDPDGQFAEDLKIRPARTYMELDASIEMGWCIFDPHRLFPGELEAGASYFAALTMKASERLPGRKFFVMDESGLYMTGANVPKPLRIVVQTGRRVGVDGVFIGQQPNELHNFVRSQLTEVVAFQITDDTAADWLVKWGFNVEELKTLAPFRYICRNNRGGETRG